MTRIPEAVAARKAALLAGAGAKVSDRVGALMRTDDGEHIAGVRLAAARANLTAAGLLRHIGIPDSEITRFTRDRMARNWKPLPYWILVKARVAAEAIPLGPAAPRLV